VGLPSLTEPGVGSRTEHTEQLGDASLVPGLGQRSRTETMPENGWNGGATTVPRTETSRVSRPPTVTVPALASLPPVPDAFALLRALRHRWLLAVSAGLFVAVLASVATYFLLPTTLTLVTATAKLRIKSYEDWQPTAVVGSRTDGYTFKRTQCDLIRTRPVMEEALREPQVAALQFARLPNAADALQQRVRVEIRDPSEIVDVSMTGDNPAQVTLLVNAVVQAYLKLNVEKERASLQTVLKDYERIKTENETRIAAKLDAIHTKKRLGPGEGNLDFTQQQALENYRGAQQEFREATNKLLRLKRQLEYDAQRGHQPRPAPKAAEIPPALIAEELEKDDEAKKLRDRKKNLENLIAGYESVANTGAQASPLVLSSLRGMRGDLQYVDEQLEQRKKELLPRIRLKLGNQAANPDVTNQSADQLKDKIKEWEIEERFAKENYLKALNEVKKFYGKSTAELEADMKEIERLQEITKSFAMEVEALKFKLNSPSRVTLIEAAREPQPRDPHRQTKTVVLAGLSAFFFVGFCTAWLEFRSQRIHSAEEIINGLGLRLLGTVPALPERIRRHPLALDDLEDRRYHNLITESFDGIRTMLLHEGRHSPLRVVMVASAISGEGKTTLSSHLALSLAHAGRRTLLVDGDLLHPTLHQMFDQRLEPGLCEVLRGEAELTSAVLPTPVAGLSLLPAGQYDRQVSQMLAKGWVQGLLDRLREEYEAVIIDSCPVLSVASTLLLGQHVDGVILSLLRDVSQVPRVYATYQKLASLGIRVVGGVFNKSRSDVYGYYGYYGNGAPEKTA
jgi:capsular exopolysaccharide synthesis family protein